MQPYCWPALSEAFPSRSARLELQGVSEETTVRHKVCVQRHDEQQRLGMTSDAIPSPSVFLIESAVFLLP